MAMVLLVDDDDLLIEVLKFLLQASGYDVITANEGSKALSLISALDLDLVISDIRMSPMNGIEVLRKSKQLKPNLPVVMLTAYASAKTAKEAQEAGAFGYLSKPFTNEEVVNTVKKAIASGKPAAPTA